MVVVTKRPILVFGQNLTNKWSKVIKGNKKSVSINKTIREKIEEKTVRNGSYVIQFNALRRLRVSRLPKYLGRQEDLPRHEKGCKFCYGNRKQHVSFRERKALSEVLLNNRIWKFYPNDFPIDKNGHFILMPDINDIAQRRQQMLITEDIQDMVSLMQNSENLLITYNSLHAGASINHIHFQCIHHEAQLCIEKLETIFIKEAQGVNVSRLKNYSIQILVFKKTESPNIAEVIFSFVDLLQHKKIPFNILLEKDKVYVIPRNKNAEVVKEFPNQVLGALDMGGRLIITDRTTYTRITNKKIENAFKEITLSLSEIENLIAEAYPSYIVGISVSSAGLSSVALIKNGRLELAIEEERIS